ncbi:hypothetical protein K438DRAFT_1749492 [Mycena galopus ATCC 62051]|nr:hypothetical protein K438DRAFT_1749492 [Mycena galopus ATCC 62051]
MSDHVLVSRPGLLHTFHKHPSLAGLVSGSHTSPSAIYPRDDDSTSVSPTAIGSASSAFTSECSIGGFNRCPNPDVSGILVRVPAYLTNLLLGIVIMYDPQEASAAVWTQLLKVYSLLISTFIAISPKACHECLCRDHVLPGFPPYIGVAVVILVIFGDYEDGYTSKAIYGITSAPFLLRSVKEQVKMMNIDGRWRKLGAKRDLFAGHYPFIHFCGVFLIPMIYWVIWNEIRLLNTLNNIFSPSFGQYNTTLSGPGCVCRPATSSWAAAWFSNLAVIYLFMGHQTESVPPLRLGENGEMVYFLLESVSE